MTSFQLYPFLKVVCVRESSTDWPEHVNLEKVFDSRSPQNKQSYFRALLKLGDCRVTNVCISSGHPRSYYELAMRNRTVAADQGDKEYRRLLKDTDGNMPVLLPPSPARVTVEYDEFDGTVADIPAVPFPACKQIHGTPARSC